MIPKLARTLTSLLPVDKSRTGSCNQCGECCKLPFKCSFLKIAEDGSSSCSAYNFRPLNCRKFPRTQSQLESVIDVCGFSFKDSPGAKKWHIGEFSALLWKSMANMLTSRQFHSRWWMKHHYPGISSERHNDTISDSAWIITNLRNHKWYLCKQSTKASSAPS